MNTKKNQPSKSNDSRPINKSHSGNDERSRLINESNVRHKSGGVNTILQTRPTPQPPKK
jgi:hypothetical protein